MSASTKYLLISLPSSITPSGSKDDALDAISATVSADSGSVNSFPIPEFKIGTLDALVQQADELAKLDSTCQAVVAKIGDALSSVLDGNVAQIEHMKTVNDSRLSRANEYKRKGNLGAGKSSSMFFRSWSSLLLDRPLSHPSASSFFFFFFFLVIYVF